MNSLSYYPNTVKTSLRQPFTKYFNFVKNTIIVVNKIEIKKFKNIFLKI